MAMNRLESFDCGWIKSLFSTLFCFCVISFLVPVPTQAVSPTLAPPRIYSVSPSTVKVNQPTVFTIHGDYLYDFPYPGATALWFYPHTEPIPIDLGKTSNKVITTEPITLPAGEYKVLVGFPQSNDNVTMTITNL